MNDNLTDTGIPTLGEAKIPTPVRRLEKGSHTRDFVSDTARVLIDLNLTNVSRMLEQGKEPPSFEMAGPREKIYFDPSKLRCALVTCGGLCPGLNGIIRSIVLELWHAMACETYTAFSTGFRDFCPSTAMISLSSDQKPLPTSSKKEALFSDHPEVPRMWRISLTAWSG